MGLDMNVYQKLNIPTSTAPAQDLDQLARTVTDIYKNSSTSDIDSGDTQSKTTAKPDSEYREFHSPGRRLAMVAAGLMLYRC